MPKQVTHNVNELKEKYRCHICGNSPPFLPPCPYCGTELGIGMNLIQYNEIIEFLSSNKGSQVRLYLGKKNKQPILSYQLLTKQQLNEMI